MVSRCANLPCPATFRYLREGRLFHVPMESAPPEKGTRVERFWLCGDCSTKVTIVPHSSGIAVVPLEKEAKHRKRSINASRRQDSPAGA